MPERRFIPPRVRGVAQNRDASLIIIATEGKATEKRYNNFGKRVYLLALEIMRN